MSAEQPTVFIGFGDERYPYEFTTPSGDHVYLHDAACTQIIYDPVRTSIVLTFRFDDSPDMAAGVIRNAEVALIFDKVRIEEFTQDEESSGEGGRNDRGQVSNLSWDQDRRFDLDLLDVTMSFDASQIKYEINSDRDS